MTASFAATLLRTYYSLLALLAQALHRTRQSSAGSSSTGGSGSHHSGAHVLRPPGSVAHGAADVPHVNGLAAGSSASSCAAAAAATGGHASPGRAQQTAQQEALRQKLGQLDPAQV